MARKRKTAARGRPSTGVSEGERVSQYPQKAMRLPTETWAALDAISRVTNRAPWRVMADAVAAYQGDAPVLSDGDRRLVRGVLRRNA
jgi:hypothetical protein